MVHCFLQHIHSVRGVLQGRFAFQLHQKVLRCLTGPGIGQERQRPGRGPCGLRPGAFENMFPSNCVPLKSDRIQLSEVVDFIPIRYKDTKNTADELKKAVKKAGKTTKEDINSSAPVRTGKYAKSWTSRVTAESSVGIEVTVYSPSRYMLAHLLENGHAKRGGGRVRAIPHIKPAEDHAIGELERDIESALRKG